MKLKPIITSPLENDLYKENMGNIIFMRYNGKKTVWCFKCRNEDVIFTPEMVQEIREQIDWYCEHIHYTDEDIAWLKKTCPWLSDGYLAYLKHWRPNRSDILINEGNIQAYNNCGLAIEAHGTWLDTSKYEIPILAIVNEVYFAFKYGVGTKDIEFQKRTIEKFSKIFVQDVYDKFIDEELRNGSHHAAMCSDDPADADSLPSEIYRTLHPYNIGTWSEFGLRRRYSGDMQDWLIKFIVDQKIPGFVGTSNMYLAKKYNVRPIGTMAHEFGQVVGQSDPELNPAYSNKFVMKVWTEVYKTVNGIVLDDVIGSEVFLKDFDLTYATLFSGVRHDSGDPIQWGENLLAHYAKLGIDATTKTLLFSDSLNFERATKLRNHFNGRCKVAFGIGTWLTNDIDVPALNIVFKITECDGRPVAKLSNNIGKTMCRNNEYVEYLKRAIDWRLRYDK